MLAYSSSQFHGCLKLVFLTSLLWSENGQLFAVPSMLKISEILYCLYLTRISFTALMSLVNERWTLLPTFCNRTLLIRLWWQSLLNGFVRRQGCHLQSSLAPLQPRNDIMYYITK